MCEVTVVVQNCGKVRLSLPPPPPPPPSAGIQNYEKLCKFSGSSFEAVELKDEKRKANVTHSGYSNECRERPTDVVIGV